MARAARIVLFFVDRRLSSPGGERVAQGETTSAIVGEVRDATNAVVHGRHRDHHKSRDRSEAQCPDR